MNNKRAVPNVMLLNARSLVNKVNELEILKENYRADLLFVTETWLTDSVPDEVVNVTGLNLVRRDRSCGRGGGVAIYVNHDIEALLVNYDWSSVLNCTDTDKKVNNFLQVTQNMISDYFQEKTVRIYSNDKPFMTHNIKRLIVERNKAFKNKEIERVKDLRRKISLEIQKAKIGFYENNVSPNLKSRPKSWWKHIKCLIGKKPAKTTMLDPTTGLQMDDKQSACYINNFFANLTKDYPKLKEDWLELHCANNLPLITVDQVRQEQQKINVNKAPGPFDPFIRILKIFAEYFVVPLVEIFNESFQSKNFPKVWKKYKVSGIPKSLPCTLVEELRPIALTSVLAKVQVSFAVRWIHEDTAGKISHSQYGGLPRSSTINALVNFIHKWHKSMDMGVPGGGRGRQPPPSLVRNIN